MEWKGQGEKRKKEIIYGIAFKYYLQEENPSTIYLDNTNEMNTSLN